MKALVFRHSLAREAASAIGGRVDRRAFISRLAPVRLEDVERWDQAVLALKDSSRTAVKVLLEPAPGRRTARRPPRYSTGRH